MIQFSMKALKADQVKRTDVLHQNYLRTLTPAKIVNIIDNTFLVFL